MKTPRILIVEDNPVNMELFTDILAIRDYECLCAENGQYAVELARSEKPDLILLDIQLPGMDGLAVASELRSCEETKNIKIIAVTAYAMRGERDAFMDKGLDGYISKPIDNKAFLETVDGFLNK